jgi:hypothetical protein
MFDSVLILGIIIIIRIFEYHRTPLNVKKCLIRNRGSTPLASTILRSGASNSGP